MIVSEAKETVVAGFDRPNLEGLFALHRSGCHHDFFVTASQVCAPVLG